VYRFVYQTQLFALMTFRLRLSTPPGLADYDGLKTDYEIMYSIQLLRRP
jgi:hypothetical protein